MKKNQNLQNELNNPAKSSPNVKEIAKEKKPQRRAEKKQKRSKRNSVLFVALQGILSVLFLWNLLALGILPFSYTMIVMAVVILLFVITSLTQKRKRAGKVLGRIFSVFVMIILIIGAFCAGTGNYILEEITGAPYEKKSEDIDFMSLGNLFSVTEDAFCVYVQDVKDGIDAEGKKDIQLLLSVNAKTHQVLKIETPGKFLVTIPGVTGGQKELLTNAKKYGIEASMSTFSNLYETSVSYYVKADTKWITELKLWKIGNLSPKKLGQLAEDILHIEEHLQTNMTKSEVRELVKLQIAKYEPWKIQTVAVDGTATESYTFSSPKKEVKGISPNLDKVKDIIKWIDRMEDDEILKNLNPIVLE